MRVGDHVRCKIKPYLGKRGTVGAVDGAYVTVLFEGWEREPAQLYPSELEVLQKHPTHRWRSGCFSGTSCAGCGILPSDLRATDPCARRVRSCF